MVGTGTSAVAVGLLSQVGPPVLGNVEVFCSGLDHCNAGCSPVVKAIARGRPDGMDGAPSLSEVWCCHTSSAVSCLMLDSWVLLPCQT